MNLNPPFQDNRPETQSFGANMEFSMTCPPDCHQSCHPTVWSARGFQPTMQTLTVNSGLACSKWEYKRYFHSEAGDCHPRSTCVALFKHWNTRSAFCPKWLLLHWLISQDLIVRNTDPLGEHTATWPFMLSTTFSSFTPDVRRATRQARKSFYQSRNWAVTC